MSKKQLSSLPAPRRSKGQLRLVDEASIVSDSLLWKDRGGMVVKSKFRDHDIQVWKPEGKGEGEKNCKKIFFFFQFFSTPLASRTSFHNAEWIINLCRPMRKSSMGAAAPVAPREVSRREAAGFTCSHTATIATAPVRWVGLCRAKTSAKSSKRQQRQQAALGGIPSWESRQGLRVIRAS